MNFASARARLKRLEAAKPPGFRFDWRLFTGEAEADLGKEPMPGFGKTWREIINEPRHDPLEMALAKLHAEHPDKPPLVLPPEGAAEAQPSANPVDQAARSEPDYPPGYAPEPKRELTSDELAELLAESARLMDELRTELGYEPLPEGDDDAARD